MPEEEERSLIDNPQFGNESFFSGHECSGS